VALWFQVLFSVPKIQINDEVPVEPIKREAQENHKVTKRPCENSDVSVHAKSIKGLAMNCYPRHDEPLALSVKWNPFELG
jgi:hypothetical protein